jgi:hemolysin III
VTTLDASAPTGRPAAKPLLRGWSHALATGGAAGLSVAFLSRCADDLPRALSVLVYGLSMCAMFAVSAVYHVGAWRPATRQVLRALDHAGIFVLIAGTYTPIAFNVLAGWERPAVLVGIWALAIAGVTLSVRTLRLPRWATAALYVGMGWAALLPAPSVVRALPLAACVTLALGGVSYTLGALVYARRWPDPLPRVFGYHEVFHLLVIAGAAAFATAIWVWVIPYPRA